MICKKCGKEVEEGVLFCSSCGEKVIAQGTTVNSEAKRTQEPLPKKKGKISPAMVVLLVIVALIAVIAGVCILSEGVKTTINVDEYISIAFQGYDGYGIASWEFDKKEFMDDYEDEYELPSSFEKKVKEDVYIETLLTLHCSSLGLRLKDLDDEEALELLCYTLFGNAALSKDEDLRNGDKITFIWDITEDFEEEEVNQICDVFGINLVYSEEDFTVTDLVEVPEFDPFEGVEISYSGAAPAGKALLANYPDNGWNYMLSGPETVTNGDEVTVSIYNNWFTLEDYIAEYGKMPSSMEKTFTVSGLPEYITSASQIPEETLAEMQAQSEDIIKGTTYNWTSGYTLDISYIGNYVLTAKEAEETPQNMVILLYKMHYTNSFVDYTGAAQEYVMDYYFYVNWDDLKINEDGTCLYDKNTYWKSDDKFYIGTNIFEDCDLWGDPLSYTEYKLNFTGYKTLDEIYNAYITRNIEDYKFEENYIE